MRWLTTTATCETPSGNVVDPASEHWWNKPWANDAAQLLGPEWMDGHDTGDK
jgi:hypothetical protein